MASHGTKKSKGKKSKKSIFLAIIIIALTAAAIAAVLLLTLSENEDGPSIGIESEEAKEETSVVLPEGIMTVRVLDVGQGDCILITSNDGKHVVIDAGTYEHPGKAKKLLDGYGVEDIEYFVLTHPDADHIGDADDILESKNVKNVIMTNETATTATFESFLTALGRSEGTNVIMGKYGMEFAVGDVKFTVISPSEGFVGTSNDASIVVMAQYGKVKFLFAGDAEADAEDVMVRTLEEKLDCDVLKAGHHGSSSSSSEKFLKAVSPRYAVISCGEGNDYGHPHDVTLKRLDKLGIKYFRTDKSGNITFTSDGVVIETATER